MIQATSKASDRITFDESDEHLIPIDKISPSPFNPRKVFTEADLQGLADSMRADGQLQNCVARTVKAGYQLICGERRWRAAKLADLPGLRCRIIECDDAKAIELAGQENYQRQELNPIEEASWFKSMIDAAGFTQASLAEHLGITQPTVSQRLGLLTLPDDWQQSVITGVIPATWARELNRWSHRPQVLQHLRKEIGKDMPASLDAFKDALRQSLRFYSRPMSRGHGSWQVGNAWHHREVLIKPSAKQKQELQIEKVPRSWGGADVRAFNVALWDELQAEAEKKASERQAARREKASAAAAKATPAERHKKQADLAKQHEKRLYNYKVAWYQGRIAEHLRSDAVLQPTKLRLLLFFATRTSPDVRFGELVEIAGKMAGKKTKRGYYHDIDAWGELGKVSDAELDDLIRGVLEQWVQHSIESYRADMRPADVEAIAAAIGVDLAAEWECDEGFLQLHTSAQLNGLAKEWKIKLDKPGGMKRKDLLAALLAAKPTTAPKSLIKAKEPR